MADLATKSARERTQSPAVSRQSQGATSQLVAANSLGSLQRAIGNSRVERLFYCTPEVEPRRALAATAGGVIQRQIDPAAATGRCPVCGRTGSGRCQTCGQPFVPIQRTVTGTAPTAAGGIAAVRDVVSGGGGQPLDASTRASMERRLGRDLGQVRIHTDSRAAASARAVDALAYTVGRDVVFARGRYDPGTAGSLRLLAHELTHVAQQHAAPTTGPLTLAPPHSPHEREADAVAEQTLQSGAVPTAPRLRAPRRVARQQPTSRSPATGKVQSVEISCGANAVTFHTAEGDVSYALTSCDLSDGEYDATVTNQGGEIRFDIGAAESGRRFHFTYRIDPGRPNPATLLGSQSRVRIIARSEAAADAGAGQVIAQIPVSYVADQVPAGLGGGVPGFAGRSATTLGLGSNVLASGDLSWLSRGQAARRVLSPGYWSPLVPRPGMVTLDRLANEVPRDLEPLISTQRMGGEWVRRGYGQQQLDSIAELVTRMNTRGINSLTPDELVLLRNAADMHIGAPNPGTPFASYMVPDAPPPNVGTRSYRVRVEVARSGALDVSVPNEFNQGGALQNITNVEEAEFLVVANQERRILSVQRIGPGGSAQSSALLRYSGAIRWGGRILIVAGAGLSAYRIGSAAPEERGRVIGEEAGGQIGGAIGTAAATAGCVFFGIATGGLGLFACGLAGGILLGAGGSALGGAIGESFSGSGGPSHPMTPAEEASAGEMFNRPTVCPTCHPSPRGAGVISPFAGFTTPSSGALTAAEIARLQRWLLEGNR